MLTWWLCCWKGQCWLSPEETVEGKSVAAPYGSYPHRAEVGTSRNLHLVQHFSETNGTVLTCHRWQALCCCIDRDLNVNCLDLHLPGGEGGSWRCCPTYRLLYLLNCIPVFAALNHHLGAVKFAGCYPDCRVVGEHRHLLVVITYCALITKYHCAFSKLTQILGVSECCDNTSLAHWPSRESPTLCECVDLPTSVWTNWLTRKQEWGGPHSCGQDRCHCL